MKQVKMIRLLDGSLHETKESADRHLTNMLSSGVCLDVFENLSNKSSLKIKQYFVENEGKIEQTMQIVRELNEVLLLNI